MPNRTNLVARLGAALATAAFAVACREPTASTAFRSPRTDLGLPAHTRVTGLGAITPPGNRLEFNFNVTDAPAGQLSITWYYTMNGGGVEYFTVNPATDPATAILYFTWTSAKCVRFDGVGRQDNGELHPFYIDACDYADPGVGYDTFALTAPPGFYLSGTLSSGDITITTF